MTEHRIIRAMPEVVDEFLGWLEFAATEPNESVAGCREWPQRLTIERLPDELCWDARPYLVHHHPDHPDYHVQCPIAVWRVSSDAWPTEVPDPERWTPVFHRAIGSEPSRLFW